MGQLAWYGGNSTATQAVGRKRPNGLGLHDMSGNVWEWVQDCWHDSYTGAPEIGQAHTTGDCTRRVTRGGSWNDGQTRVRAALRDWYGASNRFSNLGFRLAMTP